MSSDIEWQSWLPVFCQTGGEECLEKGGKVELGWEEVEQRPGKELSVQMGWGYKVQVPLNTLTYHLNCFNCQSYRPIRHGSLSAGPGRRQVGEALNIQIIHSNI